jgi:hypothetical protein
MSEQPDTHPVPTCERCRHRRKRQPITLSIGAASWSPEVMKAELELRQEYAKVAQAEGLREHKEFLSSSEGRFDYEPFTYAWCTVFTPHDPQLHLELDGLLAAQEYAQARNTAQLRCEKNQQLLAQAQSGNSTSWHSAVEREIATPDWTHGVLKPYYALCSRLNFAERPCPLFEPRF